VLLAANGFLHRREVSSQPPSVPFG
jgi:hypothetical protein